MIKSSHRLWIILLSLNVLGWGEAGARASDPAPAADKKPVATDKDSKRGDEDSRAAESRYFSNVKRITKPMFFDKAGEAYFAPDGKSIIFQAFIRGATDYQIYTLPLEHRIQEMVSTGRGACTCAFYRPDGAKIIFSSTHLDRDLARKMKEKEKNKDAKKDKGYQWDFDPEMDIFEADPTGGNLIQLTKTSGYDAEASYSPDGNLIVFTSDRDGDLEIYLMNADGSQQRRLTYGKGYDGGPFFSPDGKTILYRGDRRDDGKMNLQIRMIGVDGSNDRAITDNQLFNWCPFWHPSGKSFIFTRADHSAPSRGEPINYDLYMMKADGTGLTRITYDAAFDGLPVFDADGKRLMWTSKRNGEKDSQVFIADFQLPPELE